MSAAEIEDVLYHRSGLAGVSGISSDMRTLLASDDSRAHEAVELFVFRAARQIGALAASLGGLDGVVFTAGIGEHAPEIRSRICARCAWLGIILDEHANGAARPRISAQVSRVPVYGPTGCGMKTLFLIRHAKSSWDDTALPDKDRPLNDRGRRDAPKMGRRFAKRDVKPDLILSSPARRALTTAEIIAKKLDYKRKDIVVEDRLYSGAVHDLLNVIHKLSDKLERVMLFGHNPELTELAHRLSSEITHMPTCAIAEFMFSAKSWSNIGKAKLAKLALDYPKKSKGKASRQ